MQAKTMQAKCPGLAARNNMSQFEPALQMVLNHEGGFVDSLDDSGEATNYGISLRFYKRQIKPDATVTDIKNLTINDAAAIYRHYWWDKQPFAKLTSQKLADRVFDLVVNCGQAEGIALLQRAVNALNPSIHLVLDGALGPKTLAIVNALDQEQLYDALIVQATKYYIEISKHGEDSVFLAGWLNRLHN
jgi:lysozyme family protein